MTPAGTDAGVQIGWRIAVIDDDASVRRSVARLLRAAGFDVFTFESAEEFVNGPATPFACLVLDVQLGGQSGVDLHERLERCRRVPVVFITSHEEYTATASAAHHRAWLRKPFEARDLIDAIHRVVSEPAGGA